MYPNRKRMTVALGAVAFVGAVAGLGYLRGPLSGPVDTAHAADMPPTAVEVDVATVLSQTVTDWQSYSGRLEAIDRVDVRPLVPGTIVAVHFKDGALVKKATRCSRSTRVPIRRKSIARRRSSRLRKRALRMRRRMRRGLTACSSTTRSQNATTTKSTTRTARHRRPSRRLKPRSNPLR